MGESTVAPALAWPPPPLYLPAPQDAVRRPHGEDGRPAALLPSHPARHFRVQLSQAVVHVVGHDPAVGEDRVVDLQRHVRIRQLLRDGPAGREQRDPAAETKQEREPQIQTKSVAVPLTAYFLIISTLLSRSPWSSNFIERTRERGGGVGRVESALTWP